MGNYQRALELYEKVHAEHPENAECLRYLVAICKDLGQPCDHYQAKLSRLDQRAQQTQQSQGQLTRAAPQRDRTPPRPYSPERRQEYKEEPPQQQHLAAPKARGLADQNPERPRTAAKRPDEDEFDDADVGEMLPGM
tara:strand:- start:163 stop:573 length:411 start_codon:yes stop_codon:yes gene_type:complete